MKMKKVFSRATGLFLVLTLIFSLCSLQTSAATYWNPISGTDKWVAMPGNEVNGSPKPSNISLGSNGLTIGYTGGEYVPGGSNAGVMYALPVDLKDFSVEFTVTKKAGDYNLQNTGVDSWISLCLLNKPTAYFNVNKAGQSQGIVTLIRPMGNTTAFEINQLTNSWGTASRRAYMFPGKMTTTFTVRIKKNASGTYDYLVNGTKVDLTEDGGSDFTSAFTTLMEKGSVYFYMGVSSKDSAQQIEWRISKINGTAVKADSTATSSAAPNTSSVSSKSQTPTGNTSTGTTSNKPIVSAGSITDASQTDSAVSTTDIDNTSQTSETTGDTQTESVLSQEESTAKGTDAEPDKGFPVWAIVLIAAVVLAAGGVTAFVVIKKKKA